MIFQLVRNTTLNDHKMATNCSFKNGIINTCTDIHVHLQIKVDLL